MFKTGFLGAWPDDQFLVSKKQSTDSGAALARKYSAIHDNFQYVPGTLNGTTLF